MEREQIIKALEICANYKGCSDCKDCPLHNDEYVQCEQNVLEGLALSVIKELTEENETLKKTKYIYATVDYCADDLAEALEEIKKLTEENDRLSTALAEYEHKTNIRISEEYVHNEAYEELWEENETLKDNNEHLAVFLAETQADTVKKMQESIKNRLTETYGDLPHTNCFINAVDQIAKEMLEVHNE